MFEQKIVGAVRWRNYNATNWFIVWYNLFNKDQQKGEFETQTNHIFVELLNFLKWFQILENEVPYSFTYICKEYFVDIIIVVYGQNYFIVN